jgi:hypothetical protein
MHDYWHKQTKDTPLFKDLLWSRPEQIAQAGKLLIVGGNAHGFAAPAEAYSEASSAGIGVCRVLLPTSLQKTVGRILSNGEYAPSTPSGSFARSALASLLELSAWADATLLAGDFGRNSETAIVLEQFLGKHHGQVTLTKDTVDYLSINPAVLLDRPDTLLVISFAQLQKLAIHAHFSSAFTFDMNFLRLVDMLHEFSQKHTASIIVKRTETMFVAVNGQVSTTKLDEEIEVWRVKTAAHAAVWWLQNPTKPFEATTTSLVI